MASYIADKNEDYKSREYWEARFAEEAEYEWLLGYNAVEEQLAALLKPEDRILIIGCGNSRFSADLYDAGFHNLVNIDYSEVVITRMREVNAMREDMEWVVMDMTELTYEAGSFDVVLDKAAMDAIMVDEGSVWDPEQSVIDLAHKMCQEVTRVLKLGGLHVQISFAQPHFRSKYLMGQRAQDSVTNHYEASQGHAALYGWTLSLASIPSDKGTFDNYLYVMRKDS